MNIKYQVTSQLTGIAEEATNWEQAKELSKRVRQEYLDSLGNLFGITVLLQNEDGSWTQALCDENGLPILNLPTP